MAISGLVVILDDDADAARRAIQSLAVDPRITVGERAGSRVPLVAETPTAEEDAALWSDLLATPGVMSVDVTFVSIDSPDDRAAGSGPSGRVP